MPIDDRKKFQARQLRKHPTDAERKLWLHIKRKQIDSVHFRRQVSIGPYFADFASHAQRLIIELDGGHHGHADQAERDKTRSIFLQSRGYKILRFWNHEVMKNVDGVLLAIREAVRQAKQSPPPEKSG